MVESIEENILLCSLLYYNEHRNSREEIRTIKRMWKIITAAGVSVLLLPGCVMNTGARVYDNERALSGEANSYNLTNYSGAQSDHTVSGSAEKLEGMDTIWEFDADETEEVNISYSLTVTSGKAKLVYVSPDGIVSTLAECIAGEESEKSASDSIEARAGENRIRLVGAEGTSLEYEFTADAGEVEPFGD